MYGLLFELLKDLNLVDHYTIILAEVLTLTALFFSTYIIHKTLSLISKNQIDRFFSTRKEAIFSFFIKYQVSHRILSTLPPLIMLALIPSFFDQDNNPYFTLIYSILDKVLKTYFILKLGMLIESFLDILEEFYGTLPISKKWPIKTYLQTLKIFVYGLLGILVVSILINKSPQALLAGIGAAGAVTMLIFKDSIVSFVANIQISSSGILKVGDWVELPGDNISGTVLEISLTSIKIQNFDKTISTVPPSKIISASVKNWEGMKEAGGRRFTPSFTIDTKHIIALNNDMLKKYSQLPELKSYIEKASQEPEKHTNLGAFRNYALAYLIQDERIHSNDGFTLLVRLLPIEKSNGYLSLQLYAFTKTTVWADYESIQSEIVEHLYSIAPFFDLEAMRMS